jgi:hypothetical protein
MIKGDYIQPVDQPDTTDSPKMTLEQTLHEIAKFHFLIAEGKKGNHWLFSHEMIRDTFTKQHDELLKLFQEKLNEINQALNQTFSLPTFEEKRNFIQSLPRETQDALIYGYFQLLEGGEPSEQERIFH